MTENALNKAPLTVRENAALPAGTFDGNSAVAVGAGLTRGVSAANASYMRTRCAVTVPPVRVSVTGSPVWRRAFRIVLTLAFGMACLMTAHTPATCGVAIDVPLSTLYPPPGTDELIKLPGARSDMNDAMFEKYETASALSVEPTLIAVETHPGLESDVV